jgi:hypothetical protein
MRESNVFKFRAECQTDVVEFLRAAHAVCKESSDHEFVSVVGWDSYFPHADVVVTLRTNLPFERVGGMMMAVPDGHVMVETMRPESEYTGERTYV